MSQKEIIGLEDELDPGKEKDFGLGGNVTCSVRDVLRSAVANGVTVVSTSQRCY